MGFPGPFHRQKRHLLTRTPNSWITALLLLPAVAVMLPAPSTGPVWLLVFVFIIITFTTTILNNNGINSFSEVIYLKKKLLHPAAMASEIFSLYWGVIPLCWMRGHGELWSEKKWVLESDRTGKGCLRHLEKLLQLCSSCSLGGTNPENVEGPTEWQTKLVGKQRGSIRPQMSKELKVFFFDWCQMIVLLASGKWNTEQQNTIIWG